MKVLKRGGPNTNIFKKDQIFFLKKSQPDRPNHLKIFKKRRKKLRWLLEDEDLLDILYYILLVAFSL